MNISLSCDIHHALRKCIAFRNKKSTQICNRPTIYGDSCGYHRKKTSSPRSTLALQRIKENNAGQLINKWWQRCKYRQNMYLNKYFLEYLVLGETSWEEVPFRYQFRMSENQWWDIRFLTNHFAQLLNHNDMMTPSPSFPNNPFNRQLYTPQELEAYFNRVTTLDIPINIALRRFKSTRYRNWYKYLKQNHNNIVQKMTLFFSKSMRYKIINQANSECSFMGHWVRRNMPLTIFEKTYRNWIKAPIYIKDPSGALIFNPAKDFCWVKLWQLDEEYWSVHADETATK